MKQKSRKINVNQDAYKEHVYASLQDSLLQWGQKLLSLQQSRLLEQPQKMEMSASKTIMFKRKIMRPTIFK